MNRLSWDTTAPRRPERVREPRVDKHGDPTESDILRPGWDELRKIHRL
jgi:hypothetical protein